MKNIFLSIIKFIEITPSRFSHFTLSSFALTSILLMALGQTSVKGIDLELHIPKVTPTIGYVFIVVSYLFLINVLILVVRIFLNKVKDGNR